MKSVSFSTSDAKPFLLACAVVMGVALTLLPATVTARQPDVDLRWTVGSNQGENLALIRNKAGSSFSVFCRSGQPEREKGVSVELRGQKSSEATEWVQVIIGEDTYIVGAEYGRFVASGRVGEGDLVNLVEALKSSKSAAFTVQIPGQSLSEVFSLGGARRALTKDGGILSEC